MGLDYSRIGGVGKVAAELYKKEKINGKDGNHQDYRIDCCSTAAVIIRTLMAVMLTSSSSISINLTMLALAC